MKTNFFIAICICAVIIMAGCATENSVDYKATVVPRSDNTVNSLNEINKSAGIITKRLTENLNIPKDRIKLDVSENRISITISKIDAGRTGLIRNMITGNANLEFWETYENKEILGYLSAANNLLRDSQTTPDKKDPLFGILSPRITAQGEPLPSCMIGTANGKDTSQVNRYLKMSQVKALFPNDLRFFWSQKPYKYDTSGSTYELHAIKVTTPDGQAPLNGSVITSASTITGPGASDVKIDFVMDGEGARKWAEITRENSQRCIAVVLNSYVRSYPRVMNEISGGETEITGDFTPDEARDLVGILNSGELPLDLKIVEEQIIGRE